MDEEWRRNRVLTNANKNVWKRFYSKLNSIVLWKFKLYKVSQKCVSTVNSAKKPKITKYKFLQDRFININGFD